MNWLPPLRGLPRGFWVLWVGTLINRAGGFVAPFLTLYLVNERHLSIKLAGTLVGFTGLGSLGAGPVAGLLADRLGRRPAMAISTGGGAAAMLALGFLRAPVAIGAGALCVGFFGDMYRSPSMAAISDLVPPEDRPRAYGLIYWAANLGFAVAPVAAGLMATHSYTALFAGDAATTLAFGAISVAFVPETRPVAHARSHAPLRDLLRPYGHGAFVAFAVVWCLTGMLFQQAGTTLPLDMGAHGVAPATFGILLAMNGVLIGLFQPFAAVVTGRTPRARLLATGSVLVGFGFGLNALADGSVPVYALSIVVWTTGEIIMAGISPAVIADLAPERLRGTYMGAFMVVWGAAAALGPLAGALTLSRFGPAGLWGGCVVVGLIAATGLLRVVPEPGANQPAVAATGA